jgi:pimeloyl-ACP methyl ester carboxylesterase
MFPLYSIPLVLMSLVACLLLVIGGPLWMDGWSSMEGGEDDPNIEHQQYYCEKDRDGSFVRQPAGVVTSLCFFLASFVIVRILLHLQSQRKTLKPKKTPREVQVDVSEQQPEHGSAITTSNHDATNTNTVSNGHPTTTTTSTASLFALQAEVDDQNDEDLPLYNNFMMTTTFFPAFYVFMVALIGAGSTALHATLKRWGAILDVLSVSGYVWMLFWYALARWLHGAHTRNRFRTFLIQPQRFLATYLLVALCLTLIAFVGLPGVDDTLLTAICFTSLCLGLLVLEFKIFQTRRKSAIHGPQIRWFVISLALLAIGATFLLISNTGGPLCLSSTSWFQGHAVWHVFGSVATVTMFLHLATEEHAVSISKEEQQETNQQQGEDEERCSPSHVESKEAVRNSYEYKTSGMQVFDLQSINNGIIEYSMAGIIPEKNRVLRSIGAKPEPVLVFHQVNSNRNMLLGLHDQAVKAQLTLICVSRPTSNCDFPELYMRQVLEEALYVLDALGIPRVSLLSFSSGSPYALAFASTNSHRTTGKLMMVSPWVLPVDYRMDPTTSSLSIISPAQYFRAALPHHIFQSLLSRFFKAINQKPKPRSADFQASTIKSIFRALIPGSLSKRELSNYKRTENLEIFIATRRAIEMEDTREVADTAVAFSHSLQLGIQYQKVSDNFDVLIWHGDKDVVTYPTGVQWLAKNIPSSDLRMVKDGTHDGLILGMVLYEEMQDSLGFFRERKAKPADINLGSTQ